MEETTAYQHQRTLAIVPRRIAQNRCITADSRLPLPSPQPRLDPGAAIHPYSPPPFLVHPPLTPETPDSLQGQGDQPDLHFPSNRVHPMNQRFGVNLRHETGRWDITGMAVQETCRIGDGEQAEMRVGDSEEHQD